MNDESFETNSSLSSRDTLERPMNVEGDRRDKETDDEIEKIFQAVDVGGNHRLPLWMMTIMRFLIMLMVPKSIVEEWLKMEATLHKDVNLREGARREPFVYSYLWSIDNLIQRLDDCVSLLDDRVSKVEEYMIDVKAQLLIITSMLQSMCNACIQYCWL